MVWFYFYREKELLQAGISSYQGILCKFLWIVPPVCKGHLAGEERATFTTFMLLEIYNVFIERCKTHTAGILFPKISSSQARLQSKN